MNVVILDRELRVFHYNIAMLGLQIFQVHIVPSHFKKEGAPFPVQKMEPSFLEYEMD